MASDLLELPDGRQAEVWHGGVATGPLVMFLHGTPDSRLTARTGDAAAVRAGVHLVAINRPGYGRSDPAESGLASVADDTVAVADSLAVHRFAVLGGSFAAILLSAALVLPRVGSDLIPQVHQGEFNLDIALPIGTAKISA